MSSTNGTRRRARRKDATGQVYVRQTKRGAIYGLRFRTLDGERVYETLGRSWEGCDRREAEGRAERLLAQVRLGQYRTRAEREAERQRRESAKTTVPTFEAFAAEWLERRIAVGGQRGRGLSESGRADLSWRLAHLNGWFGGLRLDEIDEEEVERFATAKAGAARTAGGLSAASVNKCLSTAESVLAVAVRWRRIDRNPFSGYRLHAPRRRAAHLDRAAQVVALLDAADAIDRERRLGRGHGRALLSTLVFGGLRINEALSLTWRDVNLADGWLKVREGKTENATRTVHLYPPLREELASLKARRGPARDALVFPTAAGTTDGDGNVSRRLLRPAVKRANERLDRIGEELIPAAEAIPGNRGGRTDGLTLHGLRHTYTSAVLALGEDAGYVADQLGHADAGFTYSRYRKAMSRRGARAPPCALRGRAARPRRGFPAGGVPAFRGLGSSGNAGGPDTFSGPLRRRSLTSHPLACGARLCASAYLTWSGGLGFDAAGEFSRRDRAAWVRLRDRGALKSFARARPSVVLRSGPRSANASAKAWSSAVRGRRGRRSRTSRR